MLTNILLLICSSDDTLVFYCVLCMIYKIINMFKVAKGDLHALSYYSAIFFPLGQLDQITSALHCKEWIVSKPRFMYTASSLLYAQ